MTSLVFVVTAALAFGQMDLADPRLLTLRKAWVEVDDDVSDAQPEAVCLAEHLTTRTPFQRVDRKEDADVVLQMVAPQGGTQRVLKALLPPPDGSVLWTD